MLSVKLREAADIILKSMVWSNWEPNSVYLAQNMVCVSQMLH